MESSSGVREEREEEGRGGEAGPATMACGSVFTGDEKEEDDYSGGMDRISELPEGILLSILSLLTLKDAVKTSSLSRRWVGLWKSAVTVLDFDSPKVSQLLHSEPGLIPAKRIEFKEWVSGVVRQLKDDGSSKQLTKFRVSFTLTNQCNSDGDIDEWLKFATSKRVESLELSLVTSFMTPNSDGREYVFSEDCFSYMKTPAGLSDIKSLRSLHLSYVDVKGETIEHLVSNCPYLEELAVHMSLLLVKLRIAAAAAGSSLALKRLEVSTCRHLESLEIYNVPCLTHFTFHGRESVELRLEHCVNLVDVNIDFSWGRPFDSISRHAAQLTALTIKIFMSSIWFPNVAEFTRLELLTVQIFGFCYESIIGLVTLINACPRLHTLRLLMDTYFHVDDGTDEEMPKPAVVRAGRESIKTVEIIGFKGYPVDCEFMEYVLECFTGLDRIVLDRVMTTVMIGSFPKLPCSKKEAEEARMRALEFKSRASSAIEFVVI